MDTNKMIAEIKSACSALERRRDELTEKIKAIDDKLTAYHMAIDSLELTVTPETTKAEPAAPAGNVRYTPGTVVEFNGQKKTLREWGQALGMSKMALPYRLNAGWTLEEAMTRKRNDNKARGAQRPSKVFVYDGHDNVIRQYAGVVAASNDLKLPVAVVKSNITNVSREDQLGSRGYYLAYAK